MYLIHDLALLGRGSAPAAAPAVLWLVTAQADQLVPANSGSMALADGLRHSGKGARILTGDLAVFFIPCKAGNKTARLLRKSAT